MFSQVLLKSLPQSVLAPWSAVLIAGFPKVWANIPRLLVDPFVLESRSFAPFRFRHDLARRPPMSRLNILNAVEQEAFESAPVFNSFQRKQYFDFPQAIQQATANLRTPANQLCFLLSCGYFKASKRFFPARTFHPRDVEYVVGRTGLRLEQIELHLYGKETSSRHRGFILDFYGFKPFRPQGLPVLAEEIARLLRSQIKPKVIFWRCVDVLIREKIEVPGYFPLEGV
jgi:hypothetical protein